MYAKKQYQTPITWWNRREKMPNLGERILIFSPVYSEGEEMRIRIIDSQFFSISLDAEWWAYIPIPR